MDLLDYSILIGIQKTENSKDTKKMQKSLHTVVSLDEKEVYYFGLIDTLTRFDFLKKLECGLKVFLFGTTVSCIPPKHYRKRLIKFLEDSIDTGLQ